MLPLVAHLVAGAQMSTLGPWPCSTGWKRQRGRLVPSVGPALGCSWGVLPFPQGPHIKASFCHTTEKRTLFGGNIFGQAGKMETEPSIQGRWGQRWA